MSAEPKMTLENLLGYLRQLLLEAQAQNDKKSLEKLATTFDLLVEAAYTKNDGVIAAILEALASSARYSIMGVGWKIDVPAVDAIKSALPHSKTD